MIDIPYEAAVRVVAEKAGITEKEVEQKVEEKLKQLSGLISKDGAVHIVANELDVQLIAPQPAGGDVKIKDLTPNSRGVTVTGRVVQKWEIKKFEREGKEGRVANLLVGDETGVTKLVFWNDQVDVFEELNVGDVLVVKNPFVKMGWQDRLELQLNDQSNLQVNPEGVEVAARETNRPERKPIYIKDLKGGEENAEIIATIVQVYDPRFYDACPQCRRKLNDGTCAQHGEVEPDVNFNLALFLDDGTGNVRTSFWKQQALTLTGKEEADFVAYRDDPSAFEEVKTSLLGEIIKVVGNAKKNDTFDRVEFTAQLVFTDVDPAKELKNLEQKLDKARKEESAPKPAEPGVVEEDIISLDDLE